jgi:hypothetical protein
LNNPSNGYRMDCAIAFAIWIAVKTGPRRSCMANSAQSRAGCWVAYVLLAAVLCASVLPAQARDEQLDAFAATAGPNGLANLLRDIGDGEMASD